MTRTIFSEEAVLEALKAGTIRIEVNENGLNEYMQELRKLPPEKGFTPEQYLRCFGDGIEEYDQYGLPLEDAEKRPFDFWQALRAAYESDETFRCMFDAFLKQNAPDIFDSRQQ